MEGSGQSAPGHSTFIAIYHDKENSWKSVYGSDDTCPVKVSESSKMCFI